MSWDVNQNVKWRRSVVSAEWLQSFHRSMNSPPSYIDLQDRVQCQFFSPCFPVDPASKKRNCYLPCCKGIEMCDGMLRFQSFVRHDSSYDDNFPTLVSRRTWKVGTMTRIKLWWSKEGWPEHDSTAHHFFEQDQHMLVFRRVNLKGSKTGGRHRQRQHQAAILQWWMILCTHPCLSIGKFAWRRVGLSPLAFLLEHLPFCAFCNIFAYAQTW